MAIFEICNRICAFFLDELPPSKPFLLFDSSKKAIYTCRIFLLLEISWSNCEKIRKKFLDSRFSMLDREKVLPLLKIYCTKIKCLEEFELFMFSRPFLPD